LETPKVCQAVDFEFFLHSSNPLAPFDGSLPPHIPLHTADATRMRTYKRYSGDLAIFTKWLTQAKRVPEYLGTAFWNAQSAGLDAVIALGNVVNTSIACEGWYTKEQDPQEALADTELELETTRNRNRDELTGFMTEMVRMCEDLDTSRQKSFEAYDEASDGNNLHGEEEMDAGEDTAHGEHEMKDPDLPVLSDDGTVTIAVYCFPKDCTDD
jgi:hypothetical protein